MPAVESLPPLASAPGAPTTAPADLPSLKLPAPALSRAVEEAKQESAYTFLDDLLDLRLDAYQPDPNQPGYFRLRIFPRQDAEIQPIKKEVTFVIDASQSIPQHKLRATAKGVAAGLRMLRPEDTMNVVVFRNTNQLLRPTPEPATKELMAEATVLLTGLEAKGETDVYQALQPLMQTAPPAGYPSLIILLSDGRPTTGMQDSRTLINSLAADNRLRNTVFTYGSGNSVNRGLLDLLAYRNKGASRVIDDIDAVEKDLPAFLEQLSAPLLVDCKAEFAGMDPGEIFPKNLTDLYLQRPIIIYGRYTPGSAERLVVRVTGRAGEVPKEVVFEAAFKEAQSADAAVANGWAFEKAYHLIGEISRSGETPELIEALRSLSAQYGIKTSYD